MPGTREWGLRAYLAALAAVAALPLAALCVYQALEHARAREASARADVQRLARASAARARGFVDHMRWIQSRLAARDDVLSPDPSACEPALRQVLDLHPELANVIVLEPSGQPRCLARAAPVTLPWTVDRSAYLDELQRKRAFTVGRPVRGFVTGRRVIMLVEPLLAPDGSLAGGVAMPVDLDRFQPAAGLVDVPAQAAVRLVDPRGGTVSASSGAPWELPAHLLEAATAGDAEGAGVLGEAGGDLLYAFATVPGTPWITVATLPKAAALAPVRRLAALSAGALLLALVASAACAVLIARRVAVPAAALAAGARSAASGALSVRVQPAGPREVAHVGRQFNAMMDELQAAQAALVDREARLRNLFEQAADGIFRIDAAHRYLDANPAGLAMLGYSRDELMSMGVADVLVPREGARLPAEGAAMMAGRPHLAEWEHRRKDGSTFPAEVSARPISGTEYLAIVRDLAPRRAAEARQQDAAERLRLAARAAAVGFWDWDVASDRVFYSDEWKRMLGYEPHEIADEFHEWESRVHPDDLDRCLAAARTQLAAPGPDYALEFRMRHRDGTYRWILAQGAVMQAGGRPARMLGCHVDITARRRAEDALTAVYRRLMTAEERQRREISRELHDRLGQELAALRINLGLARSAAERGHPCGDRIVAAESLAAIAAAHVRDVMAELRPPALDTHGLGAALRLLAARSAATYDMAIECGPVSAQRLPPDVESAFFRIAQEALSNAAKHSAASLVQVSLESEHARIRMTIQDDGRGYDADGPRDGFGLRLMRERAASVGASLVVSAGARQGVSVVVTSEAA